MASPTQRAAVMVYAEKLIGAASEMMRRSATARDARRHAARRRRDHVHTWLSRLIRASTAIQSSLEPKVNRAEPERRCWHRNRAAFVARPYPAARVQCVCATIRSGFSG